MSRPNGMCFSWLLGKHRNVIFPLLEPSLLHTLPLCVWCLFKHARIRAWSCFGSTGGCFFLKHLSLMIWELAMFLIFIANFPFQVIYRQLEFEMKEIITTFFSLWGGGRRCSLKNWHYLAIKSFISFYLNTIASNPNKIQKMSWPFSLHHKL